MPSVFEHVTHAARLANAVARTVKERVQDRLNPKTEPVAPAPKAEHRDYTRDELRAFDGRDASKPVLLAIRGEVYDVTRGRLFYGAGGPYEVFAGKECARALAKMSFDEADCTADEAGLTESERDKLEEWIDTFSDKYGKIGKLLP